LTGSHNGKVISTVYRKPIEVKKPLKDMKALLDDTRLIGSSPSWTMCLTVWPWPSSWAKKRRKGFDGWSHSAIHQGVSAKGEAGGVPLSRQ